MSYVKNIDKIDHRVFYGEKASLFKTYADGHAEKDLFVLFQEWADINAIYGVDRHKIWKRVRHIRGIKEIVIKEGSEEWIRLRAVLDILLEADLKCLYQLMDKKYGQKKQN
jgi:hypothetical protein